MSDITLGEGIRDPRDAAADSITWHSETMECPADNLLWADCRCGCAMVLFCMACEMPVCILGEGKLADACSAARSVMNWMNVNGGTFSKGPDYEG